MNVDVNVTVNGVPLKPYSVADTAKLSLPGPIPSPAGRKIPKDVADGYIGFYKAIQKDMHTLAPTLKEMPGVSIELIKKLYSSEWNAFVFDSDLIRELLGNGGPGKYLLVLLGADNPAGTPTLVLADTEVISIKDNQVTFTATKDPVEHPPKLATPIFNKFTDGDSLDVVIDFSK